MGVEAQRRRDPGSLASWNEVPIRLVFVWHFVIICAPAPQYDREINDTKGYCCNAYLMRGSRTGLAGRPLRCALLTRQLESRKRPLVFAAAI